MDYWSARKGISIPKLGFGTWQLKGKECTASVLKALEAGYRHIDTAQIYENEEAVGKAVEESNLPREELFLTTKVWKDFLDFREILVSVSRSLEYLKVDYVDLLLVHWPNPSFELEDIFSAFKELVDTQKVKYIGVSNFPVSLLRKAKKISKSLICNQVEYHPFLSQKKLLKEVRKLKMFLTAYSPLARGHAAAHSVLKSIGARYGKSPSQAALRWLIEQKDVVVIPKAAKQAHIKSNFNIFDFKLDKEDQDKIQKLQSKNKRLVHPEWAPKWDAP